MSRPKYNTENLTPYKSKWKNGKTKLIRVPESLADKILVLAHKLDKGDKFYYSPVTERLDTIMNKIERKEKGYKSNSASALIRELKSIMEDD